MVKPLALAVFGVFASAQAYAAGNTLFDEVAPLTDLAAAVAAGDEATDGLLVSSGNGFTLTVTSLASRSTVGDISDVMVGRAWDMIDTNRTGADQGRYLFFPFEPSNQAGDNTGSGALRYDTWTGAADTIVPVGTQNWQRGDASRWAPWGGWITGEENFNPGGAASVATGRLFEVTNPLTATATNLTDGTGNLVQRNNVIPRVSHEGLAFDSANNFYFIDENSSGSFYKFVSDQPLADNGDAFFEAGTVYAMKVGAGFNDGAAGAFTWEALDAFDADGRRAADNVGATAYNRPEDMEVFTLANGHEAIAFTATGSNDVWTVDLASMETFQLVTRDTIDVATGLAIGEDLKSPDNLAIDNDGNLYIIEDQGVPNADIFQVIDENGDGVAEGVKRWAALQVEGAEPTGLFFDPYDGTKAYLNFQHPGSDNDRLVMISVSAVPEPETYAMFLAGLGLMGAVARRRRA